METTTASTDRVTRMRRVPVTDALVDRYLFELYDNQHNLRTRGQPVGAIAGILFGLGFMAVPVIGGPIGLFSIVLAVGTLRSPARSEMRLDKLANPKTYQDNKAKARLLAENAFTGLICPDCSAKSDDIVAFPGEGGHWTCPSCKAHSLRIGEELHRPASAS